MCLDELYLPQKQVPVSEQADKEAIAMSEGPTEAPRFGLDVDKDDLPEAAGKGEK